MRHTTLACFAYNHQTAKLVPHNLDHKEIIWRNEIKLISPSGCAPWFCHYKSSFIFSCKQLCPCPAPAEDAAAFLLLHMCLAFDLCGCGAVWFSKGRVLPADNYGCHCTHSHRGEVQDRGSQSSVRRNSRKTGPLHELPVPLPPAAFEGLWLCLGLHLCSF